MTSRDKIYLIGFMGSGKTTAGKKLASLLGWAFADLDKIIEEKEKKSISEIFSGSGEEYFRKIETDALLNTEVLHNAIISTGGGVPCFGENMDFMLTCGLTVYLKLTPGQLASRLSGSTDRPLIKDLDKEGLLSFIEEKLSMREKYYNRAWLVADGFDLDINQLYSTIFSKMSQKH